MRKRRSIFTNVRAGDEVVSEETRAWQRRYRRPSGLKTREQARQLAEGYLYSDAGPAAPTLANVILDLLDGDIPDS